MKTEYDIIIVGSGMGGLVSAVILAKEGLRVCVLEKNNQYGGCLQTFAREKSIFDTGVHYIGSLDEGENLHQYFKYLGILDDLRLSKMEEKFDYITFEGDEMQYPYTQGYDNFVRELESFFPEEKEAIAKYAATLQKVCLAFPLYNLQQDEDAYNQEYLSTSVKEFLDSITENEKLKSVLAGTNLLYAGDGEKTPLYIHALTVNSYIKSAWRCIFGGSQITKALVKQLRKYGGDIFKRQEVTEFIFEENTPIGVKTIHGDIINGKTFVVNLELNAAIKIIGEQHFRKSFTKRIQDLEVTTSSFSVHIKFKPETFSYLNHNIYHFNSPETVWTAAQNKGENWPEMYMLSMGTTEKAQKFADHLSILTYMDFEKVKAWENTINTVVDRNKRGEAYEKFKQEHIEKVVVEIEKKFPNIRKSIHSIHASTPLSFRDYIGGKNGNMYGFVKDAKNPLKSFVYPKTKIPNLFLTGQSVNLHGILGTTIGAVATCSEILGDNSLINKINLELNEIQS